MMNNCILDRKKVFLCMARCGITQTGLAEKSGVSRTIINYAVNGKKCSAVTLGKIANTFGVDPEELVED